MKARGALLQGGIAAGALALAAATWLRGPEAVPPGGAVIADLPRGSVQRLLWDDGSHRVEIERERPGAPAVWVRLTRSPSLLPAEGGQDGGAPAAVPPPADAGPTRARAADAGASTDGGSARARAADAGASPDGGSARTRAADGGTSADGGVPALEVAPPAPDRELRGNEAAEKLLDSFSPFVGARPLGVVDAAKLRELGLDTGTRRLEVWTPTSHLAFTISSPVGTGASYLRTEDGRVFVLGGSLVQELTSAASRLVDRRFHAFRPEDPDRLVVHLGAQTRTLLQRRLNGATRVTSESRPDSPDVYAQAWTERLVKLVPSDVLGKGEVPQEGEPRVELRVDFQRGGQPIGFVEFAKAGNAWFARSEHTAGWLRIVGRAEALVHDAERVVTGQ